MNSQGTVFEKKAGIVILNWNGLEFLRSFLPVLFRNTSLHIADIIVADNGSNDDSVGMIRNEFPDVKLIILDKNYGFAEGYNRALHDLDYKYYVLLNSDIEVTENWLEALMGYMDAHTDTAACQPKIRSWHKKDYFEHAGASGGFIDRYGYLFCRGRMMHVTEEDHGQYDTIIPVFWATGACLFIRKDDFHNAGGFDGRFFAHMEEIDLCWRLRARGRNIVCVPDSTVYHVGGGTLTTTSPYKTYLNFRNNLLMLYKNLPDNKLSSVLLVRTVLDAIAALRFLLLGDIKNFRSVRKARRDFSKMKKEMLPQRVENLQKTNTEILPGYTSKSLLVAFYLKGIRKFSDFIL